MPLYCGVPHSVLVPIFIHGDVPSAGLEATFQLFQIDKIEITPLQLGYLFMASGFVDAAIQGGVVRRVKNGRKRRGLSARNRHSYRTSTHSVYVESLAGVAPSVFKLESVGSNCARFIDNERIYGKYGTAR